MRRKSVALVMAAATVLSLMAGSGVTALADEETVELTMWGRLGRRPDRTAGETAGRL